LSHPVKALACALSVILMAGCAVTPVQTEPPANPVPTQAAPKKPPKLGLALGGGAARGFAHIGVIQVLEEAGIYPDYLVGTSAGSVVAALYASGKNGQELQKIAASMDEASFADWRLPFFKSGILKGEALAKFISTQVKGKQLQDMQIPLGVVAADLHSGQGVLFQKGDTATAVRASSAIPAVFQPVMIAGREYVDGGLVSPVPVQFARQMGAEVIVAIDISSPPESNAAQDTFQILMQTFSIMGKSINAFEIRDADLIVKPLTTGLSSASFTSRNDAIQAGRQAMAPLVARLKELIRTKSK
jgi:NTE family protein